MIQETFNRVKNNLGLSEQAVLSLLDSPNFKKVTKQNLLQLDFIVKFLKQKALSNNEIIRILAVPSYKSNDGSYISVTTAILCGEYSNSDLQNILESNIS